MRSDTPPYRAPHARDPNLDVNSTCRHYASSPKDLKNAGLKATVPRLKIISIFETSKVRHLTAEDVYRKLLAEGRTSALPPSIAC